MPLLFRERESSMSFSTGTLSCSASSFSLCHVPSLMVSKNSSLLKFIQYVL